MTTDYPHWGVDCPKCKSCRQPINEDDGCQDVDCIAERTESVSTGDSGLAATSPTEELELAAALVMRYER